MPNSSNHYQKFYVQQNKLSVYSETAASKRREECAKQQRIELEEKFRHNQYILKQFRFGGKILALNFFLGHLSQKILLENQANVNINDIVLYRRFLWILQWYIKTPKHLQR